MRGAIHGYHVILQALRDYDLDKDMAEKIGRINRDQIREFLTKNDGVLVMDALNFLKGDVLSDLRGRGSLQRTK